MKTDPCQQQLLSQQLALSTYMSVLLDEPVPSPGAAVEASAIVEPEPGPIIQAAAAIPAQAPVTDSLPEWATCRFQTLLFEVAGLTLAVPLIKLKGVVPNDQRCTSMPGHSPLFMGVVPYQGRHSKVIDTARFLLPEGRSVQLDENAGERMQHLIIIDSGRWALACSRIGDVIELKRDDVKWRGRNGKRLWLAGTVIERMCALLDVDQLIQKLVNGMA
ncbi:CheW domain protein [hydrothermal vent metagenome]|uniref:CheW domain protein n=1 Tax=hydrothermal vent metagenome TaxID=652676 RepID=A0A3B0ZKR8_9ZZZZ